MKHHLTIPVWNQEYTTLLLDYCLPALMGPGNIPGSKLDLELHIYAPMADWEVIRDSEVCQAIACYIPVKYTEIQAPDKAARHQGLNRIHGDMIERAARENAGIFLLLPDQIWSKGSLNRAADFISQGKEVIMVAGLRVDYESDQAKEDLAENNSQFKPTQLVDLFVKHMHFMSAGAFWNSERFIRHPSQIYFYKEGMEITGHCGHLHPFYLKHPMPGLDHSTVDGAYVDQYNDKRGLVKVVDDSSIIQLSLTGNGPEYNWGRPNGKVCPIDEKVRIIQGFYKSWPRIHRYFGQIELKFYGEMFKSSWVHSKFKKTDHCYDTLKAALDGNFS